MDLGTFSVSLAVKDLEASRPASFIAVDPGGNPILVDQHL